MQKLNRFTTRNMISSSGTEVYWQRPSTRVPARAGARLDVRHRGVRSYRAVPVLMRFPIK